MSVKAGEHVESWSSSLVQEEPDCEAVGQASKSEHRPVGVITDHECDDNVVRFVETEWWRWLPHLWVVLGVVLAMATLLVILSAGVKGPMSEDLMENSICSFLVFTWQ